MPLPPKNAVMTLLPSTNPSNALPYSLLLYLINRLVSPDPSQFDVPVSTFPAAVWLFASPFSGLLTTSDRLQ